MSCFSKTHHYETRSKYPSYTNPKCCLAEKLNNFEL